MSTNPRFSLLFLVALILAVGAGGACAQSPGLDEAVGPDGIATEQPTLTPMQRSAIYNAVMQQRVATSGRGINAAIGAPVPPSVALRDLPDQAVDEEDGGLLKYAMVDGNVVVVDPIAMRVVDVIRPGAGP